MIYIIQRYMISPSLSLSIYIYIILGCINPCKLMGYFFHQSTASHLSSQALKSARQMGDRARELALCVSWTTNPWVVRYMLISDLLLKHSLETGILEKLKPSQTWFLKRCCKKSGGFVSESLTFWSFQGNYAGGKHCSGAC